MKTSIVHGRTLEEVYTAERCYIAEIYNASSDRTHSLARTRVPPGVTTAWHSLTDTSEIYYILEGTGEMEVEDKPASLVSVGDSVCIPAGAPQRITNMGQDDLVFLCICRPAFHPSCYVDLEGQK